MWKAGFHSNIWPLTGYDVLLHAVRVRLAPLAKGVAGYVIGLKFAVGVGHHTADVWNDFWRPSIVWPQEHATRVIVVGMDVVPDDRGSFEDSADVFQCLNGDLLADHLATCTQDAISTAPQE